MNTVAGSSVALAAIKQSGAATGQIPSWDGSEWVPITASGTGDLLSSANLSDVADAATALTNLGAAAASHTHVAADIDAEASTDGYVLTSDGAGNAAWEFVSGGVGGASQLSELSDVNTSTPTAGNVLVADGVDFESRALLEADISDLGTTVVLDSDIGTTVQAHSAVLDATTASFLIADETNLDLNTTHRTSDGSDHTFIDQDVTSGSSPTLDATNITNVQTAALPFGTAGQQLTTNEAETALELSLASKYLLVRKASAGTIAAGRPVYIDSYNPAGYVEVEEADASSAATMPAVGLTFDSITNGGSGGRVLISGNFTGINTSALPKARLSTSRPRLAS